MISAGSMWSGWLAAAVLAAPHRRADPIGEPFHFSRTGSNNELYFLTLAAIALAVVTISYCIVQRLIARSERSYRSPRRLFRDLSVLHQLTRADRTLLREIAIWHNMADPATLFLERYRFESAAMIAALGRPAEISRLATTLFGD